MNYKAGNISALLLLSLAMAPGLLQANGNFHVLGDSFSDSGRLLRDLGIEYYDPNDGYQGGRFINGPAWTEYISEGTKLNHIQTENYAYGGALSGGTGLLETFTPMVFPPGFSAGYLTQVNEFTSKVGSLSKDDVTSVWIGMNDIHYAAGTGGTDTAVTTQVITNTLQGIDQIIDIGGKNFLVVGMFDAAEIDGLGSGIYGVYDETTATSASLMINEQLRTFEREGVNFHYLDTFALLERVQNNPAKYGYISTTATDNCLVNGCGALTVAQQNQYLFMDVLHLTAGFNALMAEYAINLLSAGSVSALQAETGLQLSDRFQHNLLSSFNTKHYSQNSIGQWQWSLTPHYAQSKQQSTGIGNSEADIEQLGISFGGRYKQSENYQLGFAANYTNSDSDLSGGFGSNDIAAVQLAGFVNYRHNKVFADAGLNIMKAKNDLNRTGVISDLKADPDSKAWGVFAQMGYLFDMAEQNLKVGPTASLRYTDLQLDSYREAGDSLLTINADEQGVKQTALNVGLLLQSKAVVAQPLTYQIKLGLEYQKDHDRSFTYSQTNAATRTLRENLASEEDLYLRTQASLNYPLEQGVDLFLSVDATFKRDRGNQQAIQGGIKFSY